MTTQAQHMRSDRPRRPTRPPHTLPSSQQHNPGTPSAAQPPQHASPTHMTCAPPCRHPELPHVRPQPPSQSSQSPSCHRAASPLPISNETGSSTASSPHPLGSSIRSRQYHPVRGAVTVSRELGACHTGCLQAQSTRKVTQDSAHTGGTWPNCSAHGRHICGMGSRWRHTSLRLKQDSWLSLLLDGCGRSSIGTRWYASCSGRREELVSQACHQTASTWQDCVPRRHCRAVAVWDTCAWLLMGCGTAGQQGDGRRY